mmetsp:Transcript_11440/g.26020  ORF Transcript_11440/g.26020 Transcript_11440/m.26020 type:complete len:204 (+) Transcript_11440:4333-4944(+)
MFNRLAPFSKYALLGVGLPKTEPMFATTGPLVVFAPRPAMMRCQPTGSSANGIVEMVMVFGVSGTSELSETNPKGKMPPAGRAPVSTGPPANAARRGPHESEGKAPGLGKGGFLSGINSSAGSWLAVKAGNVIMPASAFQLTLNDAGDEPPALSIAGYEELVGVKEPTTPVMMTGSEYTGPVPKRKNRMLSVSLFWCVSTTVR